MKQVTRRRVCVIVVALLALSIWPAWGWYGTGHNRATRLAGSALPKELPAFFAAGAETIAHCSQDPDLFRLRAQPALRDVEVPEHYFDLELLGGAAPPARRSEFIALCRKQGLEPSKVGFAPYSIAEWTHRLTLAFAEHRRWPKNPRIRAKCLVYAGLLAHYAQDACQPLHVTIHYDGRARPDGSSPRTGIHARVDALIEKAPAPADGPEPTAYPDLFAAIVAEINRSGKLVEKVYALEKQLPPAEKPLRPDSPAAAFARERLAACARFTASLFLTAWKDSAKIKLPEWHKRKAGGGTGL